jgi:predicted nuclease of predicted toxin-antitoxin system
MRFLADENFPGDAVSALRDAGHDVAWICAEAPGTPDREVLDRAMRQSRILLTFDKDFGELALHEGLPATCGIVLFRLPMPSPSAVGQFITRILDSRSDWAGHFSVIEPGRLRMRPLPPTTK